MGILELIVILLVLGWLFGGSLAIGGNFINVLLAVALIIIVVRLARGERL